MTSFTRQNPPAGFYTYAYLREDGRPYYVGKGGGTNPQRAWQRHGSKKRYWQPPCDDRILFLKWGLTEDQAHAHEIYMIAVYGNHYVEGGWLTLNFTDGGEGTNGHRHNQEFIEFIRRFHQGKRLSPKQKEALLAGKAAMTEEQRKAAGKKSAESRKANGYKMSDKTREKMSESMKGKNKYERTPEMKAAISATLAGHKQSEETIQKRRFKLIGKVRTSEMRQCYSKAAKEREQRPDVIAKREVIRQERYRQSAEKYGTTIHTWASLEQKQRVVLSTRYRRGLRGDRLWQGIAAA